MASVWNIGSFAIYIINALNGNSGGTYYDEERSAYSKGRVTNVLLNSMNLILTLNEHFP